MAIQHQIELWMSVALVFYLLAFFVAKRWWKGHLVFALTGFVVDMYATYLMVVVSTGRSFFKAPIVVQLHTALAVIAVLAFLRLGVLGLSAWLWKRNGAIRKYTRLRDGHVGFARRWFLPLWFITYLSGFALAF